MMGIVILVRNDGCMVNAKDAKDERNVYRLHLEVRGCGGREDLLLKLSAENKLYT